MNKQDVLTQRETQCLTCVAKGLVSYQIADELGIQTRTVETHLGNAMRKLQAANRAEAVAQAFRLGILS